MQVSVSSLREISLKRDKRWSIQVDKSVIEKLRQTWWHPSSWYSVVFICLLTFQFYIYWCWERLRSGGEWSDRGWDRWMASWLNGHEFEQTLGDSEGQGSLACCSPWGCKVLATTEELNHHHHNKYIYKIFLWSFGQFLFRISCLFAFFCMSSSSNSVPSNLNSHEKWNWPWQDFDYKYFSRMDYKNKDVLNNSFR